jgi:A-factor biosynthesis hotdog domain
VGPDWQFISKQICMRVVNLEAFADDEALPPEGILRARFSNKRERHGRLREITVESELTIDGLSAATVSGDLMFFPKITYERIRAQQRRHKPIARFERDLAARPLVGARVGRSFERNVTIGKGLLAGSPMGEVRYTAIVDHTHPCFFDHPLDHLPGALVIEVYRQAAIAAAAAMGAGEPAGAVITGCDVQLSDFAELEAPIECSARVTEHPNGDRAKVALTLHQLDGEIGDAEVDLEFVRLPERR